MRPDHIRPIRRLAIGAMLAFLCPTVSIAGEPARVLARHLEAGQLVAGETALAALARGDPADAEAQFALGAIRFFKAVEGLGRSFHRHGLDAPSGFGAPLFRMPVPRNPSPEPLSYPQLQAILQEFVDELTEAEATLAEVGDGEARIELDLARVRFDLDGDGVASAAEALPALLAAADPTGMDFETEGGADLRFVFDRADAIWLRGYCQILMSFADFLLAHDFSKAFDGVFHVLFPGAGLPMEGPQQNAASFITPNDTLLADGIAFIHLLNWPVAEPERMAGVRQRLLSVAALSRANWAAILAETDDDREWLPSPRQTSPFPGLEVTEEQVAAWLALLDAGEALLEGRVLLPHWRFSQGVDLKRVFDEPRDFDLVMWVTGQGALPYLAEGPVLGAEAAGVADAFGGELLRYAIWFN